MLDDLEALETLEALDQKDNPDREVCPVDQDSQQALVEQVQLVAVDSPEDQVPEV